MLKLPSEPDSDMMKKTWYVSYYNEKFSQYIYYGPHTTEKIYLFLKNMYINLPQAEKDKKNFLVVDMTWDIHFQPDTLFEILTDEFATSKTKIAEEEKKLMENLKGGKRYTTTKFKAKKKYSDENCSGYGNRGRFQNSRIEAWTK